MKKLGLEVSGIINNHPTGISRYTRRLIDGFLDSSNDDFEFDLLYKWQYRKKMHMGGYKPEGLEVKWHFKQLYYPLKPYNLIHSTDTLPIPWGKSKKIYTIHDLAVLQPHLQMMGFSKKSYIESTRKKFEFIAQKADAVICVSENTLNDFCSMFSFQKEKGFITHLGFEIRSYPHLDTQTILKNLGLNEKSYLLYVGIVTVRKNHLNMIKAYQASTYFKEIPLVLAGGFSTGFEMIAQYVKDNRLEKWVKFTDYASDEIVHSLYTHAKAFLFPTYYEGFGIPILEAYSYGLPVITSTTGSAPEISGGFATLCHPESISEITNAINGVDYFSQEKLTEAKNYARKFTWETCCHKTIEVYNQFW
ncbi:MAG: glycosyltransferase family 1 protein [Cytophagales bacterium]